MELGLINFIAFISWWSVISNSAIWLQDCLSYDAGKKYILNYREWKMFVLYDMTTFLITILYFVPVKLFIELLTAKVNKSFLIIISETCSCWFDVSGNARGRSPLYTTLVNCILAHWKENQFKI